LPFTELKTSALESISRNEDKGWILEDGKRVISFRLPTFQALVEKLVAMAGSKVGTTILYQLGNEIGRTGLRYSKDRIMADNMTKVIDDVIRVRGWGRCIALEKNEKNDKATYAFTMSECPLCFERKTAEPACDFMRGIVTGWMEEFLGVKSSLSVEKECAGVGGKFCIFEITF
jgi:predicted hydrocarbon binding protein